MKNLYILILLLSLYYVFSDLCKTSPNDDDSTLDECIKLNTPSGYDACCLLTWKYNGDSGKSCFSLTNEEVTDRNIALDQLREDYPGSTGTIVCKGEKDNTSSFLGISLIYLLVLLL